MSYFLYVLGTTRRGGKAGPSKIGISNNIAGRIERLKAGCPYKITSFFGFQLLSQQNAYIFEREIHNDLAEYRLNGEWFNMDFDVALEQVCTFFEATFWYQYENNEERYDAAIKLLGVDKANQYLRGEQ